MTVKNLIEELSKYPEDMRVFVSGYEGGFDDVSVIKEGVFSENVYTDWYYGKHEKMDKDEPYDFDGIILS